MRPFSNVRDKLNECAFIRIEAMSRDRSGLSYCAREVREHDHDRYLTVLFLPAAHRETVFALYAFNAEVARTREAVSEPSVGQIRLQWWREALDEIYQGGLREHPVVDGLSQAVDHYGIDRGPLDALLDARECDLDDAPPADLAALEAYDGAPSHVAHLVGTAWALIGLMRAVSFHAQCQRHYLPRDLLQRQGVDQRALFDRKPSLALNNVVSEVTRRAGKLLAEARNLKGEVPRVARRGLLLAVLADLYHGDIARAG
jgi:phytoene synthase